MDITNHTTMAVLQPNYSQGDYLLTSPLEESSTFIPLMPRIHLHITERGKDIKRGANAPLKRPYKTTVD